RGADSASCQRVLRVKGRLKDERIEVLSDIAKLLGLATPPGCHGWQKQLFAQEVTTECREKPEQRRALHQPGSQRVRNCHMTSTGGSAQASTPKKGIAAEFQGIKIQTTHPPQDHVHRLEALNSFEEHSTVPHCQIGPFH